MPRTSPGTVSKILWHFTGGPTWNTDLNKQNDVPKEKKLALETLQRIISSKYLRVSNYKELIKVIIPEMLVYNQETRTREKHKNVTKIIESSPVCCLADIPIQHLEYHSNRYGKFAIGFHRESAIKNGFNPVFYTLEHSKVINSIYQGLLSVKYAETKYARNYLEGFEYTISSAIDDAMSEIQEIDEDGNIDIDIDVSGDIDNIVSELDDFDNVFEEATKSVEDFVALVKTFDLNEFNTIYCEREWRALSQFNFSEENIAMIVLPREEGCYDEFIQKNPFTSYVPIIAWEDLIEH
jgi:hypothetical protein